jgi:hypothetical protein
MLSFKTILFSLFFFLLIPFVSFGQERIGLKQAISYLGKSQKDILLNFKKEGFIHTRRDEGFEIFERTDGFYKSNIVLSISSGRVNVLTLTENIVFAGRLLNEVMHSGLILLDQEGNISQYLDQNQNIQINVFNHTSRGEVTVVIYKKKESDLGNSVNSKKTSNDKPKENKPKAIMLRRAN